MQISNIRMGFANNSSSSHSIVLGGGPYRSREPDIEGTYGWENFCLVGQATKLHYMAVQLYLNLRSLPQRMALDIVRDITGVVLARTSRTEIQDSIDHQSVLEYPLRAGTDVLDIDYVRALTDWIATNPEIVILGGNDNGDGHAPLAYDARRIELPSYGTTYSRRDGDWWVLFNKQHGTKIRMSFKDSAASYLEASRPELVDLSITDRCRGACSFCYRGCTAEGQHADRDTVLKVIQDCQQAGVFEVVLGGGDVLLHPDLKQFISECVKRHMVCNTTINGALVEQYIGLEEAFNRLKGCGSVAVSTVSPGLIKELAAMKRAAGRHDLPLPEAVINLAEGCWPEQDIVAAIRQCRELYLGFTMLGYKATTQNAKHEPYQHGTELLKELLRKNQWDGFQRFGCDTAFYQQHCLQLRDAGVLDISVTGSEGKFSTFVDAVKQVVRYDSYQDGTLYSLDPKVGTFDNWRPKA